MFHFLFTSAFTYLLRTTKLTTRVIFINRKLSGKYCVVIIIVWLSLLCGYHYIHYQLLFFKQNIAGYNIAELYKLIGRIPTIFLVLQYQESGHAHCLLIRMSQANNLLPGQKNNNTYVPKINY